MSNRWRAIPVVLFAIVGCSEQASPTPAPPRVNAEGSNRESAVDAQSSGPEAPGDLSFDAIILSVAAEYRAWGRVDDELRWAPTLCRPTFPGRVYPSAAGDEPHGRKLYSVFARNREEYLRLASSSDPVSIGQAIVKQSWEPEDVTEAVGRHDAENAKRIVRTPAVGTSSKKQSAEATFDHFDPYARKDGRVFRAARQTELFIMLKLDSRTPETDEGWIYATVSPDGRQVLSVGRLESCMTCHQDAKHDRLFGLKIDL